MIKCGFRVVSPLAGEEGSPASWAAKLKSGHKDKGEWPMTTAPMVRTDEEIQRDILEELKWDARVPPGPRREWSVDNRIEVRPYR